MADTVVTFGCSPIYALLQGRSSQEAIEFGVAASALRHSIEGNYNRVSAAELEKLSAGPGSSQAQR